MNIILAIVIYIGMLVTWGEEYLPTSEVKYGIKVDSLAMESGLRDGDKILTIDNEYVENFNKIPEKIILDDAKTIQVERDGEIINLQIPQGFLAKLIKHKSRDFISVRVPFEVEKFTKNSAAKEAGFQLDDKILAIPAGAVKAYKGVGNYLKQLRLLFNPEIKAYESVGGFITIGNIFPPTWHWQSFWTLTAFLSIMLAILNVLPIPALDGGHVMFLMYEIISRRKPSDKFMEYAQITGMVLLFALLIFANGNDIVKLFRD